MHLTLWPNKSGVVGAHRDVTWPDFVSFVAFPEEAAPDKLALGGWSPARFAGNTRSKANVESISALVLDDDASKLSTDRLAEIWSDCAGAIHTSHSHTPEHPKHRIVLRVSRDMTPHEHTRVWAHVRNVASARGQAIDEATKDPSRLWFVPAHRPGSPYAFKELAGTPLDVDAILAASPVPTDSSSGVRLASAPPSAPRAASTLLTRHAAAAVLAAGFPAVGARHVARRALSGALWFSGLSEEESVSFLLDVYGRVPLKNGQTLDEVEVKIRTAVRDTCHKAATDQPVEGWPVLATRIDAVLVQKARELLEAGAAARRLAELELEKPTERTAAARRLTPAQRVTRMVGRDVTRLQTGFPTLDALTRGGILLRKVAVVGGAPGAGKTGMLVRLAYRWLSEGTPVGILAADEDADGLLTRLGQLHGLSRDAIERGDPATCRAFSAWCDSVPLLLYDGDEGETIESLSRALREKADGRPSAMLVDSIQTARSQDQVPTGTDARAKINAAMRALKHAAKVDGHVVTASSELARGAYRNRDQAENTNPIAAFKESGDVEYGVALALVLASRQGTNELVDASVVKNRFGPRGEFVLKLEHDRADVVETTEEAAKVADPLSDTKDRILDVTRAACGAPLKRTQIANRVGGRRATAFQAIDVLLGARRLHEEQRGIRLPLPGDPGYVPSV